MTLLTFWCQHHKCRHGVRKLSQRATGKTYKSEFPLIKNRLACSIHQGAFPQELFLRSPVPHCTHCQAQVSHPRHAHRHFPPEILSYQHCCLPHAGVCMKTKACSSSEIPASSTISSFLSVLGISIRDRWKPQTLRDSAASTAAVTFFTSSPK